MSKQSVVNEIHRQARRNFPRRHVITNDINDLWQADLIDLQSISKKNSNYRYILAVIDTFSKFAWVYPLKQKSQGEISEAFKQLFKTNQIPKNLQTDLGTEFYNNQMKILLNKHKINHYSTFSVKKASIVERFIRTLKSMLYKQFSLKGNYRWVDSTLEDIVKLYNSTKHRTIGMAPNQVNHENKHKILKVYKILRSQNGLKKVNTLKPGDFVRISKYKGTFEKGYTPNWSTEIFRITDVQNTHPITYLLEDSRHRPILGSFYPQELQKTKHPNVYLVEKVIRKKGNKLFVKWLGLSPEENSWIDKGEVL